MKFCSGCGSLLPNKHIPAGDTKERYVCTCCHLIHYQNPRNVVGTIPILGESILLCKRAIEPRRGYWTLPAGFMECGETIEECALRETWEEANAKVKLGALFSMQSVPKVGQVHFFYLAELSQNGFSAGHETLAVALFNEDNLPWEHIAFTTVSRTLKHFFSDRKKGAFHFHSGCID